nr:hypothetical protein Iba_chr02aCG6770 [Ipomoea batatas]GME10799.1 hypothetical protein Iba_scaffold10844CG0010 [Ipomoea batatas]
MGIESSRAENNGCYSLSKMAVSEEESSSSAPASSSRIKDCISHVPLIPIEEREEGEVQSLCNSYASSKPVAKESNSPSSATLVLLAPQGKLKCSTR